VVLITAHAYGSVGRRAREAGCDGFIAKPCLPPDLVHEISRYLKGQGTDRRGGQRRH
jgi:CheY-like chemotaxis protein